MIRKSVDGPFSPGWEIWEADCSLWEFEMQVKKALQEENKKVEYLIDNKPSILAVSPIKRK